jgi:hypothetical protein
LSRYRQVASAIFFAEMTKMPTHYQLCYCLLILYTKRFSNWLIKT